MARKLESKEMFAIKILDKPSMTKHDISGTLTEMQILRDVNHPFIASLR